MRKSGLAPLAFYYHDFREDQKHKYSWAGDPLMRGREVDASRLRLGWEERGGILPDH